MNSSAGARSRLRPTGEAGVAAVLVLALASVLALVGSLFCGVAAVAVARQRAAVTADLAALAAAGAVLTGPAAACARAERLAAHNAARLRSCVLTGDQAMVVAEVRPPGPLGWFGSAAASARAGPAG